MERGNAKMKKKRRILITFLLSVSINVIGCTEKNTVSAGPIVKYHDICIDQNPPFGYPLTHAPAGRGVSFR